MPGVNLKKVLIETD